MPSTIPVNPPSCDEVEPGTLSIEQARQHVEALVTPLGDTVNLDLTHALNQVLAEPVASPINVPPHRNSSMDGYALRAADLPQQGTIALAIIGTSFAGRPFAGSAGPGECVRIMTGATVPEGTDTVVMQEHVQCSGNTLTVGTGHCQGQNVRYPGEDIAAGETVLHAGKRLQAAELGLLASLGVSQVTVHRRVKVAYFSTGDELRAPGETLNPGQIYDSNRFILYGLLQHLDVELVDLGVIRDDRTAIEAAFIEAAEQADAVITSGGVSVGEADYVKETLEKLGQVNFWKIAMKPGKPLAFGTINGSLFFGLPGNPVSVMATFYLLVQPALRHLAGEEVVPPLVVHAHCIEALKKNPGRTDFQRGILGHDADGNLTVRSVGMQASHILSGMSRADCFIILPRTTGDVPAGSRVEVMPFEGLMS